MKYLILLLLLCFSSEVLSAQQPQQRPLRCSEDPEFRKMDFWVGEWNVTNAQGAPAGMSKIERILDSCAIQETYMTRQGKELGKSLSTYARLSKTWTQFYVFANRGGITHYTRTEIIGDDVIFYDNPITIPAGGTLMNRMKFIKKDENTVMQVFEQSKDNGSTWTLATALTCTRK